MSVALRSPQSCALAKRTACAGGGAVGGVGGTGVPGRAAPPLLPRPAHADGQLRRVSAALALALAPARPAPASQQRQRTSASAPAPAHQRQRTSASAPAHQRTSAPAHQRTSAPAHQRASASAPAHQRASASAPAHQPSASQRTCCRKSGAPLEGSLTTVSTGAKGSTWKAYSPADQRQVPPGQRHAPRGEAGAGRPGGPWPARAAGCAARRQLTRCVRWRRRHHVEQPGQVGAGQLAARGLRRRVDLLGAGVLGPPSVVPAGERVRLWAHVGEFGRMCMSAGAGRAPERHGAAAAASLPAAQRRRCLGPGCRRCCSSRRPAAAAGARTCPGCRGSRAAAAAAPPAPCAAAGPWGGRHASAPRLSSSQRFSIAALRPPTRTPASRGAAQRNTTQQSTALRPGPAAPPRGPSLAQRGQEGVGLGPGAVQQQHLGSHAVAAGVVACASGGGGAAAPSAGCCVRCRGAALPTTAAQAAAPAPLPAAALQDPLLRRRHTHTHDHIHGHARRPCPHPHPPSAKAKWLACSSSSAALQGPGATMKGVTAPSSELMGTCGGRVGGGSGVGGGGGWVGGWVGGSGAGG
jgi:hypothetical protein